MFSWTDYLNNELLSENGDIKVLKKSHLCEKLNDSIYSGNSCDEKRNIYVQKKAIKKSESYIKPLSNNTMKSLSAKSCPKILDLSPEEKEKIATLIRELGVIQSEKEKISNELNTERNKFKLELKSMERMYKATLTDKDRLEEELRKKDEALRNLEIEELQKTRNNPKLINSNDEFVIVPKSSIKDFQHCSVVTEKKDRCFPGPPKSSRSQSMMSDLLRTHSLHNVKRHHNTDRCSLLEEQKELLVEKQYLNLVLKQQKCLKKLQNKIAKLEHNSRNVKDSNDHSVNYSERSSIRTCSRDLVTPVTLNNGSTDDDSISRSISVTTLPDRSVAVSNSQTQFPPENNETNIDSPHLQKNDILLITALNHGVKETNPISSPSPRLQSRISSTRTRSPSDSLFQIIDSFDNQHLPLFNNPLESKHFSFQTCPDDDILNDLFFKI